MTNSNYPQSPANVQASLTRLTTSYNLKALAAVGSVLLFFMFYAALVFACAVLFYWSIIYEVTVINKWTILLKIGAVAGSFMLFVFTFKFMFKLKNQPINNRIKLKKNEYLEIWEFVYRVCKETGAPRPKNIYVDPDVNAYVAYSNMWMSLFFPVRKELTIGLGLVSCLNMSEFKAVVSHEFGHFSQRSMTIGSYIVTANTIIHDMIFSRDKWDELLEKWRGLDLRISFAAYALLPMIWLIRQLLNLFYQLLNVLYSSLSREMEFNADKVAVKTSGSEAIVSGLWKLDYGFDAWNKTVNNAHLAVQKQLFIRNLYTHNMNRISEKTVEIKEQLRNLPNDEKGGKLFFSSSENSKVGMYASHPSNDQREINAKTPFVTCDNDDRSPWILFSNKEKLQEELTALIYNVYWSKKPTVFAEESQFEEFIRQELRGEFLQEEYDNTFVHRFVTIPNEDVLRVGEQDLKEDVLKRELKALMQPIKELDSKIETLQQMAQGTSRLKELNYGGVAYNKRNLDRGYNRIMEDRNEMLDKNFKDWDKSFFTYFYLQARTLNKAPELMKLYRQHQLVVEFYQKVVNTRANVFNRLQELQQREEVEKSHLANFVEAINKWMNELNKGLKVFNASSFVALPNISTPDELKLAIIEGGTFVVDKGNIFENGGFDKVIAQLEDAPINCQRIDQKSINAILEFHEELKVRIEESVTV